MQRACSCPAVEASRGVALVVALLVLAVLAALATMSANEFMLSLRRSQNVLRSEQAWEYLLGAEQLAVLLMEADPDPSVDHLGEIWAQGMQAYQIEGGWLRGSIEDLQGRFNVNLLVRARVENELPPAVPSTENERRFVRLLRAVGGDEVDEHLAQALTEAVIDWIDADIEETGFGGAEDSSYGNREPPFRPANRPVVSLSELRLLPDMTSTLYEHLAPHLSAWPQQGAAINVNTATEAVLSSLGGRGLTPLDASALDNLIAARGEEGWSDLNEFTQLPLWPEPPPADELSVRSDWFLLHTEVEFEDFFWRLESVLERRGNEVHIVARSLGGL